MVVTRLNPGCPVWNAHLWNLMCCCRLNESSSGGTLITSVVMLAGVPLRFSWGNAGPLPLRKPSPHTCPMLMWIHLFSVSLNLPSSPPRRRKSHAPIHILYKPFSFFHIPYEYESVWTCSSEWQIGESCKLTSGGFFKTCPKIMYWKENGAVRNPKPKVSVAHSW